MKRGKPLARHTRLEPGSGPARTGRLAKIGSRAKRSKGALKRFREFVLERAGGHCEMCGVVSTFERRIAIDAHHIVGRGRAPGWSKLHDPEVNGLGVCHTCHGYLTQYPALLGERFHRAYEAWVEERSAP